MLSPIVAGMFSILSKVVVCGRSTRLESTLAPVSPVSCGVPVGKAGERGIEAKALVQPLQLLQHADFQELLRNCLKDVSRFHEFDLPSRLFPGAAVLGVAFARCWHCQCHTRSVPLCLAPCLAVRPRICTMYISKLNDPEFAALSPSNRVVQLKKLWADGGPGYMGTFNMLLQRYYERNQGTSLVKSLHATLRAQEYSAAELGELLDDGIMCIPVEGFTAGTPLLIEEVRMLRLVYAKREQLSLLSCMAADHSGADVGVCNQGRCVPLPLAGPAAAWW
jgi:hypothetical protein